MDSESRPPGASRAASEQANEKAREQERPESDRTDAALRASDARFQAFMEHSPALAWIVDLQGRFTYVSPPFARTILLGSGDPVGKSIFDIFPPALAQEYWENNQAAIRENRAIETVETGLRADGTMGHFLSYKFPIRGTDGNLMVGGMTIDITDRKEAERALRESEERFRVAQELSLDAFEIMEAVRDPAGRVTDFRWIYANPAAERIFGLQRDGLIGQGLLRVFPGTGAGGGLYDALVHVVETGEPHDQELHYDADDISGWFRIMAVKLGDGVAVCFNDITERKRAEEARLQADRRKDEFLATLAHELRNPLAPIRNAVEILRMKGLPDPQMARARDIIERQVQQMTRLIDDLLDVARITQGKQVLHEERIDLETVVGRALEASRPLITAAGHDLQVRLPPAPVYLDADPTRLAQVLANLLDNAAKYTPPGGRVTLAAERAGQEVVIRVSDNGIGIPPEMLSHIFEPFAQLDSGITRAQGGLGIGLTLVERLVAMHGGTVTAASAGVGCGSELTVRLPLAADVEQRAESPPGALPLPSRPVRRILVVDDNRDAADSLASLIASTGNQTWTAYDGLQALHLARQCRPDIIILDIGMPGMSGHEVARRLRQQPETRDVLLVALTGWGQDTDRQRSKEAGFDYHLVKPLAPGTLDELLCSVQNPRSPPRA